MKKNLFGAIAPACIAVAFLAACEKHTIDQPSPTFQSIPVSSTERLHDQLTNPDDAEDEAMNDNLYMLAQGFTSFSNNSELMTILYNYADEGPNAAGDYEVMYSTLVTADARFKSLMNSYLQPRYFTTEPANYDCLTRIDNDMVYRTVDYYPNVYVPNLTIANRTMNPIICIGASIDDESRIMGFKLNGDGTTSTYYILEAEALASRNEPIIIFNNATAVSDPNSSETILENSPNETPQVTTQTAYVWSAWRINGGTYRYETGNNASEIKFVLTQHNNSGTYLQNQNGFNAFGEHRGDVGQVSKNEAINSTWKAPSANLNALFGEPLTAYNSANFRYAYITTYEYDWYASSKPVKWCDDYSTTFAIVKYHHCKMKYTNEWYHNMQCHYDLLYHMPGATYIHQTTTTKFNYRLKRVQ